MVRAPACLATQPCRSSSSSAGLLAHSTSSPRRNQSAASVLSHRGGVPMAEAPEELAVPPLLPLAPDRREVAPLPPAASIMPPTPLP